MGEWLVMISSDSYISFKRHPNPVTTTDSHWMRVKMMCERWDGMGGWCWPKDVTRNDDVLIICHKMKDDTHTHIHNRNKMLGYNIYSTFLRNEQPSVRRALPPVGWQRTVEQEAQNTTVAACENMVVIWKQPGHFTSMKNELGDCTKRFNLCWRAS